MARSLKHVKRNRKNSKKVYRKRNKRSFKNKQRGGTDPSPASESYKNILITDRSINRHGKCYNFNNSAKFLLQNNYNFPLVHPCECKLNTNLEIPLNCDSYTKVLN